MEKKFLPHFGSPNPSLAINIFRSSTLIYMAFLHNAEQCAPMPLLSYTDSLSNASTFI